MLIEASKGGHTSVVNLLLDWPSQVLSPSVDVTVKPSAPSVSTAQPRVPNIGLPNIVPPQDPNAATHGLTLCRRTGGAPKVPPINKTASDAAAGTVVNHTSLIPIYSISCGFCCLDSPAPPPAKRRMPEGAVASKDTSPKTVKDANTKRAALNANLRSPLLRQLLPKSMSEVTSREAAVVASAAIGACQMEDGTFDWANLPLQTVHQLIQNISSAKDDSLGSVSEYMWILDNAYNSCSLIISIVYS